MNERLKSIRSHFGINQEVFGSKLGVTKTAISRLEKGERNLTEQMIKSICREFNVNEDWLRNGIEPMFIPTVNDELKQLAQNHNFSEIEYKFFYEYLKLNLEKRQAVVEFLENIMNSDASLISSDTTSKVISLDETVATKEENTIEHDDITSVSNNKTVEELEAEYIKSRSKIASKQAATASNITDEKRKAQ